MMKRRIIFSGLSVFLLLFCLTINGYAGSYKVKKGDSLYTISKQLGVSVNEIKKTNHLAGNKVKPGQILSINQKGSPAPARVKSKTQLVDRYTVKKGDTLARIAKKTGVPAKQIAALNDLHSNKLRAGRSLILSVQPSIVQAVADEDELLDEEEDAAAADPAGDLAYDEKSNDELMGKWGSADERKLFIKVATGFLGAPYRLGGATVKGIDCSAFVRKMYSFFDISLPRTAREQSAVGVRIDRSKLEEGDLVFFRTRKPIGHVGIYIGNNEFVHASYRGKSVRIDSLDQPYFQKRFQRGVRVKGLEDNKDGT